MFSTGGHNAYYILMGINILSLTVVVLFWPETKGISLKYHSYVSLAHGCTNLPLRGSPKF